MPRRRFDDMNCSIAQSLDVLGDWWTLLIIRECFMGTRRFADFEAHLGIAKNVLSARLKHLVEHEIVERVDVGQAGHRYHYRLTHKGKDLITVITALRQWGDRWIYRDGDVPIVVRDSRTDRPIPPLEVRGEDGLRIPARAFRVTAGPGADAETRARFGQTAGDDVA